MTDGIRQSPTNFEIVVHDIVAGRDADGNGKIGVRGEMRGTHTGDMFGIPATGRAVRVPIHAFHDARLTRTRPLEDWFGFFQHVGHALKLGKDNQWRRYALPATATPPTIQEIDPAPGRPD